MAYEYENARAATEQAKALNRIAEAFEKIAEALAANNKPKDGDS